MATGTRRRGAVGALAAVALLLGTAVPAGAADVDWSVLSRFGGDADGNGLLDEDSPASPADLSLFAVLVKAPAAVCGDPAAEWSVDRERVASEPGSCVVRVRGERPHVIAVRSGGTTTTAHVKVDDKLVVALGDSVGSGEGNPVDRKWLDAPCHRSAVAGFEQAARLLGEGLEHRSVTFVNLSCSGAQITSGLLDPYRGVAPREGVRYLPQVDRLTSLVSARGGADAVLLSIGANDVTFSQVVKSCAAPGDCRLPKDARVFGQLEDLSARYDRLAPELERAAPRAPVVATEYFDPTHDARGRFCRQTVGFITRAEAQWAYESLVRPLNTEVAAAARRHGWRLVDGIAKDFGTHGYCAGPAERWVRRLEASVLSQGDLSGTLHPDARGHAAIARRIAPVLSEALGLPPPPPKEEDEGLALWLKILIGVAAALVLAAVVFLAWRWRIAPRMWRLVRASSLEDPCQDVPPSPARQRVPATLTLGTVLIRGLLLAGLLAAAVVFVGVVGGAILWVRFWAARLPADQAVDAVGRGELVTTGAQALVLFTALGLAAAGLAWMLDRDARWGRATRRGLGVVVVVEVLVAVLIEGYRGWQVIQILAGLAVVAVLMHFLVDRFLFIAPSLQKRESLVHLLGRHVRELADRSVLRGLWRFAPLVPLGVAIYAAAVTDGNDRWIVVPLLALAALMLVLPGGLAADAPGETTPLEVSRVALTIAVLACIIVLLARDEAWLAAALGVAALLAAGCLAVAAVSGDRFAPYGVALVLSVALFGGATAILRAIDSPEMQPVAAILDDGEPLCGVYVGESDGRLWVGHVELAELGHERRPAPRRGQLVPIDIDRVSERVTGPLQPVARAQDQSLELRDELLTARGDEDPDRRLPSCVAQEPPPPAEASWQRTLAEQFQPELVIDRLDGFWPIPVRTLFAMQDRRARACRQILPGDQKMCVRLSTQGALPWSGGAGESIEYPAANDRRGEQHDLMTDALSSVDPARTAREYFLVAGDEDDRRPVTLQYWSFYSFNYQPLNTPLDSTTSGYHEGDFESVGVLLSATTHRPRYVWTARHDDEGRVFAWQERALERAGDHARVFAARGSHASYESCGRHKRLAAPGGLIDDRPTCDERRQLHLSAEATPMTDLSRVGWACWRGLFGHRRAGGYESVPYLVNDAPRSPLWQQEFDDVVSRPCTGVSDPGGREGLGEEVVEESTGVPARLRRAAGRLDPLVDECSDWESPPADGTYMVACSQDDLTAYVRSGFEDPGTAGVRIDKADVVTPDVGEFSLPAVQRDFAGNYLDEYRITAARPHEVAIYASCPMGAKRLVAARFGSVRVDPDEPLRLSDRAPGEWRLVTEEGEPRASATPVLVRGKKVKKGRRLACAR